MGVLDKVNLTLFVANAGDSRALLVRSNGEIEAMSTDHKPEDSSEKSRIEKALFTVSTDTIIQHGKRVKVPRIDGKLAVSRAIGDDMFKGKSISSLSFLPNFSKFFFADIDEDPAGWAVTPIPDVKSSSVKVGDVVIFACDGLWDVCDNEYVKQWIEQNKDKDCNAMAEAIAQHAIDKGSDDNVTVVILKI